MSKYRGLRKAQNQARKAERKARRQAANQRIAEENARKERRIAEENARKERLVALLYDDDPSRLLADDQIIGEVSKTFVAAKEYNYNPIDKTIKQFTKEKVVGWFDDLLCVDEAWDTFKDGPYKEKNEYLRQYAKLAETFRANPEAFKEDMLNFRRTSSWPDFCEVIATLKKGAACTAKEIEDWGKSYYNWYYKNPEEVAARRRAAEESARIAEAYRMEQELKMERERYENECRRQQSEYENECRRQMEIESIREDRRRSEAKKAAHMAAEWYAMSTCGMGKIDACMYADMVAANSPEEKYMKAKTYALTVKNMNGRDADNYANAVKYGAPIGI